MIRKRFRAPPDFWAVMVLLILLMISTAAGLAAEAPAEPANVPATMGASGLPIPRFVSITAARVNLRMGPGRQYPIAWILQRRHLPVEIIDEFEHWRKIREQSGSVGWVHKTMLSGKRMGLVIANGNAGELSPVYPKNSLGRPAMMAETGAIGEISQCSEEWCAIRFEQGNGWMRRDNLWGLYPGEEIE
jgi:SH3-like domain-containing protein